MPALATLTDDFQDGVIDPSLWVATAGVAESGGRLIITPNTSRPYCRTATASYSLIGSQVVTDIPTITANGSTGTLQSAIELSTADASGRLIMRKYANELQVVKYESGVTTGLSFTPYNATTHRFWRVRESGGIVYWETSATGSGWFIQNTATVASIAFSLTSLGFYFYSTYTGFEFFPGTLQVEAVNPGLPISASGSSISSGSLAITVTAPLSITGHASSTSAGSLAITLAGASNLPLAASGASNSAGRLLFSILGAGAFTASAASTSSGSLTLRIPVPPTVYPGGTWFFEPPIIYDLPRTIPGDRRNQYARRYSPLPRGRSVLKHGAIYTIVDTPSVDQMAAADIAYQGGHIYEITVEEAYSLFAAGFNVYHGTDLLIAEDGDFITTESGDLIEVEYSLGSS